MTAAIIILYHPIKTRINELLRSIINQVDHIYLIDNTPNIEEKNKKIIFTDWAKTTYIPLNQNKGIALAQNIGIEKAKKQGNHDVILFDQDSLAPENMISTLKAEREILEKTGIKISAIGPLFIDEKNNEYSKIIRHNIFGVTRLDPYVLKENNIEADYIISSGSLIKIDIFEKIGLFREELFIDWVDIEWCLRAHRAGYNCYVTKKTTMRHKIGDADTQALGRKINLHNDFRNYFIVRNAVYLLKSPSMGFRWKTITILKIPQYVIFYSIHSKNKFKSLVNLSAAIIDGIRKKFIDYKKI